MKQEDRSKLRTYLNDAAGLRNRDPDEKKFSDWKRDVEKKLEDAFGKGSEELSRFKRIRFFDFTGGGRSKDAALSVSELRAYASGLDEARRLLQRFVS